jgi:hypothetical protein
MYRQWDRGIDTPMLYKILPEVKCTKCEKDYVIVFPSFLKRKGIAKDDTQCLVIVLSKNVLKTVYWCKDPNYITIKHPNPHFQFLY